MLAGLLAIRRQVTRATGSTFGTLFRVTTWGESHGKSVGCVIDGCPSNMAITTEEIQAELDRRRPGQSRITTPRSESGAVVENAYRLSERVHLEMLFS
jgi:chorismate synthase